MAPTQCIGISSVVSGWLEQGLTQPTLLARFEQVINIAVRSAAGPEVLALCSSRIGRGPLNVVVEPWPDWSGLDAWTSLGIDCRGIRLGEQYIDCTTASRWDPRPDWGSIAARLDATGVDGLRRAAAAGSARSALLAVVCGKCPVTVTGSFLPAWQQLQAWLRDRDEASLRAAAAACAGLGAGLTPTGDDFLCGLMLGLWATSPAPQRDCDLIANTAVPMTTALSAAFLRRAAAGQVTATWMNLLHSLGRPGSEDAAQRALAAVMAWGHSSGADTLAGFLWLCSSAWGKCGSASQCA
jgi:hypothetical protein